MVKITWMTFGRIAGLESLASPLLRLYYIYKVWYGVQMRDGLSMVRPRSGLLTTSVRELVMVCKSRHLRGIGCQADLDQSYNLYAIFRITTLFNYFFNTFFLSLPYQLFSIQFIQLRAASIFLLFLT